MRYLRKRGVGYYGRYRKDGSHQGGFQTPGDGLRCRRACKTALTGSQISLPVHDGELVIGERQGIVFADFDGPRPRTVYAAVVADQA